MRSTWLNFGEILRRIFFSEFFPLILNPFSPVEHSICHILEMVSPIDMKQKRKWVNWMLCWLGYLWSWHLTLTFDLENSRSNCISGMGGSIVMEQKWQETLGCPDVKHNHCVTPRQRIFLRTGWLKMSAFPSTLWVWDHETIFYPLGNQLGILILNQCFSQYLQFIAINEIFQKFTDNMNLIHRGLVTHRCISERCFHWFMHWLVVIPNLNQNWCITTFTSVVKKQLSDFDEKC